ncbi:MAG: hypothetical protein WCO48_00515 [Candidatus Taylorbacteria bacterium]
MPIIPKSRQTIVVSVICLLIVVATLVIVYGFPGNNPANNGVVADATASLASQNMSTSTDWQKSFYEVSGTSTKPYGADLAATTNSGSSTEILTNTDILGRNFLTVYSQMHQAGIESDSQTVSTVANKLASNSLAGVGSPNIYYGNDIKIVADSSANAGTYAKSLSVILSGSIPSENEAVIADNAFQKNDMTILKKIDPVIAGYNKTIKSLLATPVPQSASQYHIDLVNGFSMQVYNATALRHVDSDPVLSLAAIGQVIPALQRISTALVNLQRYFNTSGVTFIAPTPGQ